MGGGGRNEYSEGFRSLGETKVARFAKPQSREL
jgi:hypothetical protein